MQERGKQLTYVIKKFADTKGFEGKNILRNTIYLIHLTYGLFGYELKNFVFLNWNKIQSNEVDEDIDRLVSEGYISFEFDRDKLGGYGYILTEKGHELIEGYSSEEIDDFFENVKKDIKEKYFTKRTNRVVRDYISERILEIDLAKFPDFTESFYFSNEKKPALSYIFWIPTESITYSYLRRRLSDAKLGSIQINGQRIKKYLGETQGDTTLTSYLSYILETDNGSMGVELFANGMVVFSLKLEELTDDILAIREVLVNLMHNHLFSIMNEMQMRFFTEYTEDSEKLILYPSHNTICHLVGDDFKEFSHHDEFQKQETLILLNNDTGVEIKQLAMYYSVLIALDDFSTNALQSLWNFWHETIETGEHVFGKSSDETTLETLKEFQLKMISIERDVVENKELFHLINKTIVSIESTLKDGSSELIVFNQPEKIALFNKINSVLKFNNVIYTLNNKLDDLGMMNDSLESYLSKLVAIATTRYEEMIVSVEIEQRLLQAEEQREIKSILAKTEQAEMFILMVYIVAMMYYVSHVYISWHEKHISGLALLEIFLMSMLGLYIIKVKGEQRANRSCEEET